MATKKGVVITISGEDKSGAVLDEVRKHLAEVREQAEASEEAMGAFGEMADRVIERMSIYFAADAIVDGFKDLIEKSVDLGEEMGHLAQQTGISSETLSVLKFAADKTGISFETFTKGFKKLGESLFEFQQNSLTYVRAFALIGIGQKEITATGGDMYKMLELVADKMSQMPDGWKKSAAASEIFGRAGVELIPVLNQGAAGIASFRSEAQALGVVIDSETVEKMEKLREKSADVKGAFSGLAIELASDLTPALAKLGDLLVSGAKNVTDYLRAWHISPSKSIKMAFWADLADITKLTPFAGMGLDKSFEKMAVDDYQQIQQLTPPPKPKKKPKPTPPPIDPAAAAAAKAAAEALNHAHQRVLKAQVDAWKKDQEQQAAAIAQQERTGQELARFFAEEDSKKSEAAAKGLKQQTDVLRAEQEERIKAATEQMQLAERMADFEVQMGRMSASERVEYLRNALNTELAIKQDAQRKLAGIDVAGGADPARVRQDLDAVKDLQQRHDDQMQELAMEDAQRRKAIADGLLHSILDPLMQRPKSIADAFKQMADSILSDLTRISEHRAIEGIEGYFDPGHMGGGGIAGVRGFGGLGGIFGKLFHPGGKASNGGLATGAGTIADSAVSALQQGRGGAGASGVVVNILNQGTPQQVSSSGSSGGNGLEHQIITIVMKDADTLGPMSKALGGAISMIGKI